MSEKISKLDRSMAVAPADSTEAWHDARELALEGKGWTDTLRFFDRLPARAEGIVRPPVWTLSRHSAGMCVRFETDSPSLSARWTLLSPELAMSHMPATGVSGLDLYARHAGAWRWCGVGRPEKGPDAEAKLTNGFEPQLREYMLYLPLYNGVESLRIGAVAGCMFRPAPVRKHKPVVFYGTSIVHGGCASRTGMAHPAILGRRLDRPVINLGFSGNGRMEPEMAALLAELDASVFVLDALPNLSPADDVEGLTLHMVRTICAARPAAPIVLVEDRTHGAAPFAKAWADRHAGNRMACRRAFDALRRDGVAGLHYVEGARLLSEAGGDTVDGSHPTDLGFTRIADALETVLRPMVS